MEKQDKIPQARVLYCSATGASEPRNMGYMVRLGLWGAGTSFSDFNKFLGWFSFLSPVEYILVEYSLSYLPFREKAYLKVNSDK